MSEPYLIAHLVRGEPAFDIAIQLPIGDEQGWIIPTSGHRAYPYCTVPLDEVLMGDYDSMRSAPPPDWPDHYAPTAAPKGQGLISNLAERLGLVPKPPTITRR